MALKPLTDYGLKIATSTAIISFSMKMKDADSHKFPTNTLSHKYKDNKSPVSSKYPGPGGVPAGYFFVADRVYIALIIMFK